MYWCEAYHDFVESVLLDGSGRILHFKSTSGEINPFSIAVRGSGDDIYITDTNWKRIIVQDRSPFNTFEFVGSFQSPTGIVINQGEGYGPIHFIKSEEGS